MSNPLVSIIIPSYNSIKYLESAIKSIKAQTYKNLEIVVVDDGSTDNTRQWLKSNNYGIKVFYQSNYGAAYARNKGVELCSGEYVAFLDSDDLWLPTKLEKQMQIILENENIKLVFSDGYIVNNENYEEFINKCYDNKYIRLFELYGKVEEYITFDRNFKMHSIPTSSMLFRKKDFIEVGGMPKLIQGEDFALCQFLLNSGKGYAINEPLIAYRKHDNNTSSNLDKMNFKDRMKKILNKDSARIIVLNKSNSINGTSSNIKYDNFPLILRLFILLFWRVKYGSNYNKIISDIKRYLFNRS